MPTAQKIAWIIRSCRESRGYSQEYMADMLNIVQSAYANIESGKTTLTIDRLIFITTILGLDIHEVIKRSLQASTPPETFSYSANQISGALSTDTKEVYEQLVDELRSEVHFLRTLLKKEYS